MKKENLKIVVIWTVIFLLLWGYGMLRLNQVDRQFKSRAFPELANIGITANDGTGTTLRAFANMMNNNWSAQSDTNSNKPTFAQLYQAIFDSLMALRADALTASTYLWLKTDTGYTYEQVITYNQLQNYAGGGSGVSKYKIQFIVGSSGFPADGDSVVTHTTWIGKEVELSRDGIEQGFNITATNTIKGFRLNNTTGAIIVMPPFIDNEEIIIKAYNPMNVTWLTLSGTESTLLTGLRAGWQLNEVSGSSVSDVLGTYNGTTTGVVNAPGKFGYAEAFTTAANNRASLGTTVGDVGTNDFSVACWVYVGTLQSANLGICGNWDAAPLFYLNITNANKLRAKIDFGAGNVAIESNAAISAATWTHFCMTADRSGNMTLYVNGVAQTALGDISSYSATNIANSNVFEIGSIGGAITNWTFQGTIDDVYLWTKALSQQEVTDLQTKTYPFN